MTVPENRMRVAIYTADVPVRVCFFAVTAVYGRKVK